MTGNKKMKQISFVLPSRDNLKYLKWAYASIRKNADPKHWICLADDASTDGTWNWIVETMKQDKYVKAIRNSGPRRMGHCLLYDKIVNDLVETNIFMIFHADMYLAPGSLEKVLEIIKPKTVVSMTRIEPPLHPPGPEKIVFDFGTEPENFKENDFLKYVGLKRKELQNKTSQGMFAPWAIYKEDFDVIGGHDPLYAPQSREDSLFKDRILLLIEKNEIKLMRIEELFNKYNHLSEQRNDGKYFIDFKKHKIKISTATAMFSGKVGRNYINKIIRKENKKELIKVRTMWGETICTMDHSLIDKNLNKVKPYQLQNDNIWYPKEIGDWKRRTILNKINFNEVDLNIREVKEKRNSNAIKYIFPIIRDIDEYGNNKQLLNICEFFGFFVADGSTHINYEKNSYYFSFNSNDLELLDYFKEKSYSLFPDIEYGNYKICKKEGSIDVYKYCKGSKIIAHLLRSMVGKNSKNKQVPTFIFNIPKVYQEAFLYGYLSGDEYENIFPLLSATFTSKSDMLITGINYLLRKNYPKIKTRIQFSEGKKIYNISTCKYHRSNKITKTNLGTINCFVYDLEVEKNHTFIDAMGLFGLHNSDIFNRFVLTGYEPIQTWEAFVYHMTCRGSRFNPKLTRVGQASDEWLAHNRRSERNFTRKWGSMVKVDENLRPMIPHKYDISFVVTNCNFKIIESLEPWCTRIYCDANIDVISQYINNEQWNTMYILENRILPIITDKVKGDIVVKFDGQKITQELFTSFIMQISSILDQLEFDHYIDSNVFEYDIFDVTINRLKYYEKELIICDKNEKTRIR